MSLNPDIVKVKQHFCNILDKISNLLSKLSEEILSSDKYEELIESIQGKTSEEILKIHQESSLLQLESKSISLARLARMERYSLK